MGIEPMTFELREGNCVISTLKMHKIALVMLIEFDYEHVHPPFDVNTTSVIQNLIL